MYQTEKVKVDVLSYSNAVDDYGQIKAPSATPSSSRQVEMMIKRYTDSIVNNPIFNDVEYIGLTDDKQITDANRIKINNVIFNIVSVIPSNRLYQVLFKKV